MTLVTIEQAALLSRAVAVRLRARRLLDRLPLRDALAALTPAPRRAPIPRHVAERAVTASERICERLHGVPRTCLYRSLARYAVMRRAGYAARFVLGLDLGAGELFGHAWVEVDGAPVGEERDPALTVTFAYP